MNLVRNQDAVDHALAAHRNVRLRSQYASDTVLLSEKSMGLLSPCGITTFPSEKLRDELTNFLAGQSAGPGKGGRIGAFLAGEVLSTQFPDKVTEFVLDNRPSAFGSGGRNTITYRRGRGSQFGRLEKKPSILSTLWTRLIFLQRTSM